MATTVDDRRETVSLIGSDKVEGTAVYGADDNKIGNVQRIMIDKISGKVAYAVVSFGGFLGMGEDYYPMPWPNLKYDTRLGGYRVGVTEDQLKARRNTAGLPSGTGLIGPMISGCTATTIHLFGIDPVQVVKTAALRGRFSNPPPGVRRIRFSDAQWLRASLAVG